MGAYVDVNAQVPLAAKHFLISGVVVFDTSFCVAVGMVTVRGPKATSTEPVTIEGLSQVSKSQSQVASVIVVGMDIFFSGVG